MRIYVYRYAFVLAFIIFIAKVTLNFESNPINDTFSFASTKLVKEDNARFSIIEIGVARCSSLRMWADFVEGNVRVHGVDINRVALQSCPIQDDLQLILADVSKSHELTSALTVSSNKIIVDDGSHVVLDMITSYMNLRQLLAPNALYIIEDIGCTHNSIYTKAMLSKHQGVPIEDIEYFLLLNNRRVFERFIITELNQVIKGTSTKMDFIAISKEVMTFHSQPNFKMKVHIHDVIKNSFPSSAHASHRTVTVESFINKFKDIWATLKQGETATFTFNPKTFISSITDEQVFGDWIAIIASELDAGMKKKNASDILIIYFGKGWIFVKKDDHTFKCKKMKADINLTYYPTLEKIDSIKLQRRKNKGHTLTELADYYKSDKGSLNHCYTPLYEHNYNLILTIERLRI